jgi:hypothetical protein
MSGQLERLSEVEILQSGRICEGEPPSAPKCLAREARPESRVQSLTIVLERLWLFYEAMRQGKPLTDADQMLAQIGTILRYATKPRRDSAAKSPTKRRHGGY